MLQQQEYSCAGNRATLGECIQLFLPTQSCKIAIIEHLKETAIVGALGVQTQPKKNVWRPAKSFAWKFILIMREALDYSGINLQPLQGKPSLVSGELNREVGLSLL